MEPSRLTDLIPQGNEVWIYLFTPVYGQQKKVSWEHKGLPTKISTNEP